MSDENNAQSVLVIDRTCRILELAAEKSSVSLKDIYTSIDIGKASALRIANALCANGYLIKDERTGDYSLSYKCYGIGISAVRNIDYINFIRETLEMLSRENAVVAQFSVDEGNELFCLESFDSTSSNFSVYTHVGYKTALYATSAGKAILSAYSDDKIAEKWKHMNIEAFTPNTITTFDDLMEEIYSIRSKGYAVDREETSLGLFCVGMPLIDYRHEPVGAISLSTNTMTPEKEHNLSFALSTCIQRLTYMLSINTKR